MKKIHAFILLPIGQDSAGLAPSHTANLMALFQNCVPMATSFCSPVISFPFFKVMAAEKSDGDHWDPTIAATHGSSIAPRILGSRRGNLNESVRGKDPRATQQTWRYEQSYGCIHFLIGLKGKKATEVPCFPHDIQGFPAQFPLNHSDDFPKNWGSGSHRVIKSGFVSPGQCKIGKIVISAGKYK